MEESPQERSPGVFSRIGSWLSWGWGSPPPSGDALSPETQQHSREEDCSETESECSAVKVTHRTPIPAERSPSLSRNAKHLSSAGGRDSRGHTSQVYLEEDSDSDLYTSTEPHVTLSPQVTSDLTDQQESDQMGRRRSGKKRRSSQGDGGGTKNKSPTTSQPSSPAITSLARSPEPTWAESAFEEAPKPVPDFPRGELPNSPEAGRDEDLTEWTDAHISDTAGPSNSRDARAVTDSDMDEETVIRLTETPESKRRSLKVSHSEKFFAKRVVVTSTPHTEEQHEKFNEAEDTTDYEQTKAEDRARCVDNRSDGLRMEKMTPFVGRISDKINLFESQSSNTYKSNFTNPRRLDISPAPNVSRQRQSTEPTGSKSGSIHSNLSVKDRALSFSADRRGDMLFTLPSTTAGVPARTWNSGQIKTAGHTETSSLTKKFEKSAAKAGTAGEKPEVKPNPPLNTDQTDSKSHNATMKASNDEIKEVSSTADQSQQIKSPTRTGSRSKKRRSKEAAQPLSPTSKNKQEVGQDKQEVRDTESSSVPDIPSKHLTGTKTTDQCSDKLPTIMSGIPKEKPENLVRAKTRTVTKRYKEMDEKLVSPRTETSQSSPASASQTKISSNEDQTEPKHSKPEERRTNKSSERERLKNRDTIVKPDPSVTNEERPPAPEDLKESNPKYPSDLANSSSGKDVVRNGKNEIDFKVLPEKDTATARESSVFVPKSDENKDNMIETLKNNNTSKPEIKTKTSKPKKTSSISTRQRKRTESTENYISIELTNESSENTFPPIQSNNENLSLSSADEKHTPSSLRASKFSTEQTDETTTKPTSADETTSSLPTSAHEKAAPPPASTGETTIPTPSLTDKQTTHPPASTEKKTTPPPESSIDKTTAQQTSSSDTSVTPSLSSSNKKTTPPGVEKTTLPAASTNEKTTPPTALSVEKTTPPPESSKEKTNPPAAASTTLPPKPTVEITKSPAASEVKKTTSPAASNEKTTPPPASSKKKTTPPPASTVEKTTPPTLSYNEKTTPPPSSFEKKTTPPPASTVEKTTPPTLSSNEKITPPPSSFEKKTTPPPASTVEKTTHPTLSSNEKITPPPSSSEKKITPPSASTVEKTTPPTLSYNEKTTPPPSSFEKKTTPPPASTVEKTTPPTLSYNEKTTPPPSSFEKKTTPPPASTVEKTTPPAASSNEITTPPAASSNEKTTPPPASTVEMTTPPAASSNVKTTPPAAASNDKTTPPPASTEKKTTPPPASSKEKTTPPPASTVEKTTPPAASSIEQTTPPPASTVETTASSSEKKTTPTAASTAPSTDKKTTPPAVLSDEKTTPPQKSLSPVNVMKAQSSGPATRKKEFLLKPMFLPQIPSSPGRDSLNRDSVSSWLDVERPVRKKLLTPDPKLSSSVRESSLLEASRNFDPNDFISNVKRRAMPFTLPKRRHKKHRLHTPQFAMPPIREDRNEKPFDAEEFQHGLRKRREFTLDLIPSKTSEEDKAKRVNPERESILTRSVLFKRAKTEEMEEEKENESDESKPEAGRVRSRLERCSILSSLRHPTKTRRKDFLSLTESPTDVLLSPSDAPESPSTSLESPKPDTNCTQTDHRIHLKPADLTRNLKLPSADLTITIAAKPPPPSSVLTGFQLNLQSDNNGPGVTHDPRMTSPDAAVTMATKPPPPSSVLTGFQLNLQSDNNVPAVTPDPRMTSADAAITIATKPPPPSSVPTGFQLNLQSDNNVPAVTHDPRMTSADAAVTIATKPLPPSSVPTGFQLNLQSDNNVPAVTPDPRMTSADAAITIATKPPPPSSVQTGFQVNLQPAVKPEPKSTSPDPTVAMASADASPPLPSFDDIRFPGYLEILPKGPEASLSRESASGPVGLNKAVDVQTSENSVPVTPPADIPAARGFHRRPGKIVIYQQRQFSGQSFDFYRDEEDVTHLQLSSVISVKVLKGCWILFEKAGFVGRCIALEEEEIVEFPNEWAEEAGQTSVPFVIGSLRLAVRDYTPPLIELFSEADGRGRSSEFVDDTDELGAFGLPQNTGSIKVHSGLWQVFSDAGFQGLMAVLERGEYPCPESWGFTVPVVGSLRALRMGSVKVQYPNAVKAVLYEKAGLQGGCVEVQGDVFSFRGTDGEPDGHRLSSVASLKILRGLWVGYDEDGFEGQQFVLEEGEYLDWRDWGGTGQNFLSLRPVLTDFSSPHMKMFSDSDFFERGVNVDVMELLENTANTEYGPQTRSIDVLSGAWVVFDEPGFCGQHYVLEKGLYSSPEDWGSSNSTILSVIPVMLENQNSSHFKIQLFSEPEFSGTSVLVEDTLPTMPQGFTMSSCRVHAGSWLAFGCESFSGSQCVLEDGDYPDLRMMGFTQPESSVRSLQPVGHEFSLPSIALFERSGLRGRRLVLKSSSVNLQLTDSCTRVSSILVEGGIWVLYESNNFRGSQFLLKPGEVPDWPKISTWSRIGSLRPLIQKQAHFRLRNKEAGLMMSVVGSMGQLMRIQATEEMGGVEQVWMYQDGHLQSKLLAGCFVDASSGILMAGSRAVPSSDPDKPHQLWNIRSNGLIQNNAAPNLVLEVKGGQQFDRNQIIINEFHPNKLNQRWSLELL